MVDFSQARVTMVDTQIRPSDVTYLPVIEAMLSIPRELFVPASHQALAYAGEDIPRGDGRVMLDPRVLAKMVNVLALDSEDTVLEIGCGSGYGTTIMAHMAGTVVGIESDPAEADKAQQILAGLGIDNAAIITGPLPDGQVGQGPYDIIIITGGAVEEVPKALTDQLREGGRIIALFREDHLGVVRIGYADGTGHIDWRDLFNAFAPVLPEFTRPRGFKF